MLEFSNRGYNDDIHFVLDQHAQLDVHSASEFKQQSAGRHVAPFGIIILNGACKDDTKYVHVFTRNPTYKQSLQVKFCKAKQDCLGALGQADTSLKILVQ